MNRLSFVYILTNPSNTTLYIGVTNNLKRRIWEHKEKKVKGFTSKYNITKLVYYELFESIELAIQREKQLKGGSRNNKLKLITKVNPYWDDLYDRVE